MPPTNKGVVKTKPVGKNSTKTSGVRKPPKTSAPTPAERSMLALRQGL
jgi:hypothetical protein